MTTALPRDLAADALAVGLSAELTREISAQDVLAFARLSGDENPLHTDPEYAAETNYGRPIVHGAFQIGLASALLGMQLPGKRVVLGSVRSRFPAPLFYPCRVAVRGEIISWFPEARSGMLRARVSDADSAVLCSEIHMGFSLHEARAAGETEALPWSSTSERELVLVTGATGGLGRLLCQHLAQSFDVLGLARRVPAATDLAASAALRVVACDLEADDWEASATAALGGRRVYALVHAAWPGAPQGGLLDLELEAIRRQLDFGGLGTIRIARWLAARASQEGRLILLGSTAATLHPELRLAAYSLGKASLEHALRLLAPELAARGITINGVLPSYMPLGINQAKPNRAALLETARVPLGRLCTPGDVLASVDYFLSRGASFVTGQLLPLTGGRL
jgi:NAD(P)-dependent dehydrogenase (short-subunit alcohol dehydrogenase family)/acyl dehydratase